MGLGSGSTRLRIPVTLDYTLLTSTHCESFTLLRQSERSKRLRIGREYLLACIAVAFQQALHLLQLTSELCIRESRMLLSSSLFSLSA
jgi:hypothetical protein